MHHCIYVSTYSNILHNSTIVIVVVTTVYVYLQLFVCQLDKNVVDGNALAKITKCMRVSVFDLGVL